MYWVNSVTVSERYSRQIMLSEIGEEGQRKLGIARVLCIGAGGLGSPALLYLAGAGVGTIGIVDFDRVDVSNLQRQILFTEGDQGKPKADAAKARLLALNPGLEIHAYPEELTDRNALSLFSRYDIIIDGTDNFPAKFLINDVAVKLGKPVVYGAIQGFDGQVSVFGTKDGPCYRCLHPIEPKSAIMNCAESGVIGAVAGLTGTVQALEVIKMITGHDSFSPLAGKLWLCDARMMDTRIISIPKRPDCPVCSKSPEQITPRYASPLCGAFIVQEITCDDEALADAFFIDVREREEWEGGHIAGAHHLPLSDLQNNPSLFEHLQGPSCCILYCQKGGRSRMAAELLRAAGFSGIYSLSGGYETWCLHHGLPETD